ncbi:unnamed protein product [Amoebophrya sp. A25]|nr:unnamed protein product [Amoebophrya sp. A25]|eukprot:GSA25T00020442001.1
MDELFPRRGRRLICVMLLFLGGSKICALEDAHFEIFRDKAPSEHTPRLSRHKKQVVDGLQVVGL